MDVAIAKPDIEATVRVCTSLGEFAAYLPSVALESKMSEVPWPWRAR